LIRCATIREKRNDLEIGGQGIGQSAVTGVPAGRLLEMPPNAILVLSSATGEVRVLDCKGVQPVG
jgi:hypothetical protein